MDGLTCRLKEYIQPFERQLALQELRALVGGPVVPIDGNDATASAFRVTQVSDRDALRGALTYWRSVGDDADGLTAQLRGEATSGIARNGASLGELPKTVRTLVPRSCRTSDACVMPATDCTSIGASSFRNSYGR